MNQNVKRGLVAAGVLAVVGSANAAALDVTAVADAISGTVAPITTIGSGTLLIIVALKTFMWIRQAIRG